MIIFLRKRAVTNYFRDLIIGSIECGAGNQALLCSGFFQEFFQTSSYQASSENKFSDILLNNNIELTTVGIHNYVWLPSYKNFRDSLVNKGVNILAKYSSKFHWHAKIFILKKDSAPIFGIIGSSNLTRNAFSVSSPFNYEADVVLWSENNSPINNMMSRYNSLLNEFPEEIIIADYNSEKNNNQTIEYRLSSLENDIKKHNLKDLPE